MCLMAMPAMASVAFVPCGSDCDQTTVDINNVVDVKAVGIEIVQILNHNYYILPSGKTIPVENYRTFSTADGRAGSGAVWFNEQGRAKQLPIYNCSFVTKLQPPCTPPFKMA